MAVATRFVFGSFLYSSLGWTISFFFFLFLLPFREGWGVVGPFFLVSVVLYPVLRVTVLTDRCLFSATVFVLFVVVMSFATAGCLLFSFSFFLSFFLPSPQCSVRSGFDFLDFLGVDFFDVFFSLSLGANGRLKGF